MPERSAIRVKVVSVKRGEAMTFLKFEVAEPAQINWVMSTKTFDDQSFASGDEVDLVLKAVQVVKT